HTPEREQSAGRSWRTLGQLITTLPPAVIMVVLLAFVLVPPYPKGEPGHSVSSIGDLIQANLESLTPHIVWPPGKAPPTTIVSFDPSLTNTIVSSRLVIAFLLILALIARRGMPLVPHPVQNAVELGWERLENWAVSLGGDGARRHIPLFAAFFLFILFSN